MYSSAAIANTFLRLANRDGEGVDPMKLQKLVYLSHGWHLGHTDEALSLEPVQAWRWGPVFPDLYHAVKHWGREPVRDKLHDLAPGRDGGLRLVTPRIKDEKSFDHRIVEAVWRRYGRVYTGPQLSMLTHQAGTPWHDIWMEKKQRHNAVIPNSLIAAHYQQKLAAARARS